MPEALDGSALPGIAALPPTTVRQIGSSQVLVDPSSVVKELIDNALDARAKSIFVDITANTLDSIQVKDDGHGIPSEDRALACRRYCTSKIRDFQDLKSVGGRWLGFRGEALASMAEMSGTLAITTRVEGEPVAVKLKYLRSGELASTERDSHPVGTTVKVTNFFESAPVRKQTALKSSAKWLTKIRSLMQAYALARPTTRFRLHVLKARSNKGDFIYAPKAKANVEDAVLKIMGKDCALQCDWTAQASDGFEMHAYLPNPTAVGSKIANHGSFISVDSRPMSTSRGVLKKMVSTFKSRLHKASPSLAGVRDPFFFLNIICPSDSYDPNVEPAKDDVMFEDGNAVITLFDKLLVCYYPEAITNAEVTLVSDSVEIAELLSPDQPRHEKNAREGLSRSETPDRSHEIIASSKSDVALPIPQQEQPLWTSSMWNIDEDDVGVTRGSQLPEVEEEEEEEERRATVVSNPWTIARMNASMKPKRPNLNPQLPSPAKSQPSELSSPVPFATHQAQQFEPPTPHSSSRENTFLLNQGLQHWVPHVESSSPGQFFHIERNEPRSVRNPQDRFSLPLEIGVSGRFDQPPGLILEDNQFSSRPVQQREASFALANTQPRPVAAKLRRSQVKRQSDNNQAFVSPEQQQPNDTWFGQPMRGTQSTNSCRLQKQSRRQEVPVVCRDNTSPSSTPISAEDRFHCTSNADIRAFFSQRREIQDDLVLRTGPLEPHRVDQPRHASPQLTDDRTSISPPDIADKLRAYAEREAKALHSTSPPKATHPHPPKSPPTPPVRPKPHRRRSTLHRTPSTKLPLERTPRDHRTYHLLQHTGVSTTQIARAAQTQMHPQSQNSVPWTVAASDAYPGFSASADAPAGQIVRWAGILEELMRVHGLGERVEGVDVCEVLRAGLQRGMGGGVPGREVVDLSGDGDEGVGVGVDADMAVPSVEVVKVEDESEAGDGDDEMLMDL